jgi:hypothetical protein
MSPEAVEYFHLNCDDRVINELVAINLGEPVKKMRIAIKKRVNFDPLNEDPLSQERLAKFAGGADKECILVVRNGIVESRTTPKNALAKLS